MSNVTHIHGEFTSLTTMLEAVQRKHPDAISGIVIVVDEDGATHCYSRASGEEMAFAAALMLRKAAGG